MTEITKSTLSILKNFLSINKSIVIKPGSTLKALSLNKNVLAVAEVEEKFDREIAIYDLSSFIGGLTIHETPILDTSNDAYVLITDPSGNRRSKYFYADPDIITQAPEKDIDLPSEDVSFNLNAEQLRQLSVSAVNFRVEDLCIFGSNGTIQICVTDKKNSTSNSYSIDVGQTDKEFCYCLKIENLKFIPDNYTVTISNPSVARFVGKTVTYFVALEP